MNTDKVVPLLTVNDFDEAKSFYIEKLGFVVAFENEAYLGLRTPEEGKGELGFMKPGDQKLSTFSGDGLTYCLEVKNVDVEHDRLLSTGVTVIQPPQDNPWGDRSCIITAPYGVAVYIYQPIETAPEFKSSIKE